MKLRSGQIKGRLSNEAYRRQKKALPPIVAFVGASSAGKTSLLEQVVRELKSKGYRVAVIKHCPHGFDIDQPDKDSSRLFHAGSDLVAVSGPGKAAFMERVDGELSLEQIRASIGNKVDIVLAEGYKDSAVAKIVVMNAEQAEPQMSYHGEILGVASVCPSPSGGPQFDRAEIMNLTNMLIKRVDKNGQLS